MATITFALNPDSGLYESQFQSGSTNLLQIEFNDNPMRSWRSFELFARVSSDLPWVRIKLIAQPTDSFMFAIDIPSGVELKAAVNELPKNAGFKA